VDGVKTADPDFVPNARTLDICTYEEVAEIAHQGAKVVHPRAAEIAMDYGIPLWVKSTFSDHPGTRIVGEADVPEEVRRRVTGVTHTGKIVFIRLEIENEPHKAVVEQEVYRLMARAGVNIYLVSFSPTALSFAVSREMYPIARDLLDGMIVPVASDPNRRPVSHFYIFKFSEGLDLAYSAQRPLMHSLEEFVNVVDVPGTVVENGTMVSVIANKHRSVPGIIAAIYETLTAAGIQILQVADSEMSISCLVTETEAERAVRLLHDRFALGVLQ
jgi:aspartate kinase